MSSPLRYAFLGLCAGMVLLTASCSDGRKTVHPAKGKVINSAGKPVVGATVVFHPISNLDDIANKPAGITGADGEFILTTYVTDDGAPVGEYAVTVEWRDPPKGPTDSPPDKLQGKFRDPKTSPFKSTVNKGPNTLTPIQLP